MPLPPIKLRPDAPAAIPLTAPFGKADAHARAGDSPGTFEEGAGLIASAVFPVRAEQIGPGAVPPEWAGLAEVLQAGERTLAGLLDAVRVSGPNPPPMPAALVEVWVTRLSRVLPAQHARWRTLAEWGAQPQPDPSATICKLAGVCRFLGHACVQDVHALMHLMAASVGELHRAGLPLSGHALAKLGLGLGRLRATEYSPEARQAAARLLNALAGHLGATRGANAYTLAGLFAGLRHQSDPNAVRPYLAALAGLFGSLDGNLRLGSLFIQTALPGIALLPSCPEMESMLRSIAAHLAPTLAPSDQEDARLTQARLSVCAAVVELMPHLGQEAGRALALAIIRNTETNCSLPKDSFVSPQKTDEWLRTSLSVSSVATQGVLDLHGMRYSLAAFAVESVITHALTALPGKNRLEIIFGRASHTRSNEGLMRAVVENVIAQRREVHGEKIGALSYTEAAVRFDVRGRRSQVDSALAASSSASSTPTSRSANIFDALVSEPSLERTSTGSRRSANKKKKRSNLGQAAAGPRVIDLRADAGRAPAGLVGPARGGASPSAPASGWLAWVRGWFRT